MKLRVALLTLSDKGNDGLREDRSGPMIEQCMAALPHEVIWQGILPDEQTRIERQLRDLCDEQHADLILTTGGTGLSPRDVTPEATMSVADKLVPGIPEAMRVQTAVKTSRAMLSRGVAAIRGKTLIVNLPGSPRAVQECMEVILPVLDHAVGILKGDAGECGTP